MQCQVFHALQNILYVTRKPVSTSTASATIVYDAAELKPHILVVFSECHKSRENPFIHAIEC
jgi:hypothetical protein